MANNILINPIFLSNSIIQCLDYNTGKINIREENPPQEFKKMNFSYVFRFNSVQFLLVCWDGDISDEDLEENKLVLEYQYPYTILSTQGNHSLSRCTSGITYHHEYLIDVSLGQNIFDSITFMLGTYSDESQQKLKNMEKHWQEEEKELAKKHPR